MRNSRFWWILVVLMLVVDIYFFQALLVVTHDAGPAARVVIYSLYWVLSVASIVIFWSFPRIHFKHHDRLSRSTIFSVLTGLFFAKLVGSLFFLGDDISRFIHWAAGNSIHRSYALSWAGIIGGGSLFSVLVYGFGNKYRYQVKRQKLQYENLPEAFKGLRIVHISDIHAGSFTNKEAVMQGVERIMETEPDLILFTGDLVNNVAEEMNEYIEVFEKLNAPLGVYSVLGNHDYGDYMNWKNEEDKLANLEKLKNVHGLMGWRLLMNEHVVLEKNGDRIAILGIENWSAKARFPKYGNLQKAYEGAESHPFKILLSHDPSHWKAEVLKDYPGIDLMLAGHTHGMQFGFELAGFKWSPIQYVYKEWAGLYETERQRLYVNRGFGFLGYPGRSGILPEITVLELS